MRRTFALLLSAALAACAGPQIRQAQGLHGEAVELTATPFFAQEDHQCGPAALATVLAADGVGVVPDDLVPLIYLPQRKGSLQTELIAATRHYQRLPYLLQGGLPALLQEVESGKPVLVLQNLGVSFWPAWHYAVVVGFDPERNQLILRSGRKQRLRMSARSFLRTWNLAAQWALVVTTADRVPVTARPQPWVQTAAAFESLQQISIAARAYAAGLQRWPQEPLLWFASANAAYAARDLPAAAAALRRAVELAPDDAAARNNLAQVLIEQGCGAQAGAQLDLALQHATPGQRAQIEQTQAALAGMPAKAVARECPR